MLQCGKMLSYWEMHFYVHLKFQFIIRLIQQFPPIHSTPLANSLHACQGLFWMPLVVSRFFHIGLFLVSTVKDNLAGCIPWNAPGHTIVYFLNRKVSLRVASCPRHDSGHWTFEILKHWGHHSIWLTREEVGNIHKLCHQLKSIQVIVICLGEE